MLLPISRKVLTSQGILKIWGGRGGVELASAFDYTRKSLTASKGVPERVV